MRRSLIATTAFACALGLAACGGTGNSTNGTDVKTPDKNATLTFMDAAPNSSLDPASVANDSSFSQASLYAIYDRLVGFDADGEPVPQLATKWTFSKDLTELTLTLRSGVKFHDGEVFDAEAVKANLDRSKSLGAADAGKTVSGASAKIASVEAEDATTVVIKLSTPDGGFVYNLGTQLGMMVSPASLDGSTGIDLKPIGAGPFAVADFKPTDTTTMDRYDAYWDGPQDRPAKLVVKYVVDSNTRLNAVRSGQATVSIVAPNQVSAAESGGLESVVNPTASVWNIYLNTSRELKDERVRQALMYAIDRKGIAKALSFDTSDPTVQLIPQGSPGHVDSAESEYPYDPAKAKKLLKEAGLAEGLELDYILLNSPEYSQLTDVLQQQFKAVGVDLKIDTLDISQAGSFSAGEQGDMMLARWGGRADQLETLETVVGANGTYAPAGAVSQTLIDALKRASDQSVEDESRGASLEAANQEAIDQAATVPIMTRANIYAFEPGCIGNLKPYLASGSNDWRDITVGEGC